MPAVPQRLLPLLLRLLTHDSALAAVFTTSSVVLKMKAADTSWFNPAEIMVHDQSGTALSFVSEQSTSDYYSHHTLVKCFDGLFYQICAHRDPGGQVEMEFPAGTQIHHVRIINRPTHTYDQLHRMIGATIAIRVEPNADHWSTTVTEGVQVYEFWTASATAHETPANAVILRMRPDQGGSGTGFCAAEVLVRDADLAEIPYDRVKLSPFVLNETAMWNPELCFDNDLSTKCCGADSSVWLEMEYPPGTEIAHVQVIPADSGCCNAENAVVEILTAPSTVTWQGTLTNAQSGSYDLWWITTTVTSTTTTTRFLLGTVVLKIQPAANVPLNPSEIQAHDAAGRLVTHSGVQTDSELWGSGPLQNCFDGTFYGFCALKGNGMPIYVTYPAGSEIRHVRIVNRPTHEYNQLYRLQGATISLETYGQAPSWETTTVDALQVYEFWTASATAHETPAGAVVLRMRPQQGGGALGFCAAEVEVYDKAGAVINYDRVRLAPFALNETAMLVPENCFDGDTSTLCCGADSSVWLEVEFPPGTELGRVRVVNPLDCCQGNQEDAVIEMLEAPNAVTWGATFHGTQDVWEFWLFTSTTTTSTFSTSTSSSSSSSRSSSTTSSVTGTSTSSSTNTATTSTSSSSTSASSTSTTSLSSSTSTTLSSTTSMTMSSTTSTSLSSSTSTTLSSTTSATVSSTTTSTLSSTTSTSLSSTTSVTVSSTTTVSTTVSSTTSRSSTTSVTVTSTTSASSTTSRSSTTSVTVTSTTSVSSTTSGSSTTSVTVTSTTSASSTTSESSTTSATVTSTISASSTTSRSSTTSVTSTATASTSTTVTNTASESTTTTVTISSTVSTTVTVTSMTTLSTTLSSTTSRSSTSTATTSSTMTASITTTVTSTTSASTFTTVSDTTTMSTSSTISFTSSVSTTSVTVSSTMTTTKSSTTSGSATLTTGAESITSTARDAAITSSGAAMGSTEFAATALPSSPASAGSSSALTTSVSRMASTAAPAVSTSSSGTTTSTLRPRAVFTTTSATGTSTSTSAPKRAAPSATETTTSSSLTTSGTTTFTSLTTTTVTTTTMTAGPTDAVVVEMLLKTVANASTAAAAAEATVSAAWAVHAAGRRLSSERRLYTTTEVVDGGFRLETTTALLPLAEAKALASELQAKAEEMTLEVQERLGAAASVEGLQSFLASEAPASIASRPGRQESAVLATIEGELPDLLAELAAGDWVKKTKEVVGAMVTAAKLGALLSSTTSGNSSGSNASEAVEEAVITLSIAVAPPPAPPALPGAPPQAKPPPKVEVQIPAKTFVALVQDLPAGEELTMVVTVPDAVESMGTGEVKVEAAMAIDIQTISGLDVETGKLAAPISFTLPTVYYDGLTCSFFDTELKDWSREGVETASENEVGGPLQCKTWHLSLFGAIFQGFLDAIMCSNLALLNEKALKELFFTTEWHSSPGAKLFFLLLGCLAATFLAALLVDCRRGRHYGWSDEFFLLPVGEEEYQASLRGSRGSLRSSLRSSEEWRAEVPKSSLIWTMAAYVIACLSAVSACCRESALREALDEIVSSYIEFFGELRTVVEGIWEGLELSAMGTGRVYHMSQAVMSQLVVKSSQRLVAASMGLSPEVVHFVMDDKELKKMLLRRSHRLSALVTTRYEVSSEPPGSPLLSSEGTGGIPTEGHAQAVAPSLSRTEEGPAEEEEKSDDAGANGRKKWWSYTNREDGWVALHDEICDEMERSVMGHSWCSLPRIIFSIFMWHNPLGYIFARDVFKSCKLRAFFMSLELVGDLLVVCIFFSASGAAGSKEDEENDECNVDEELAEQMAYKMGRILAIAMGSVVLAGLPVSLLRSLHIRHFKKFPQEGGLDWSRQLRAWQLQHWAVWVLGSLYLAFGLFFTSLFLANIASDDHEDWTTTGATSLAQEAVIIPLGAALFMPTLTGIFVTLVGLAGGMNREALLQEVHGSLYAEHTEVLKPVVAI